MKLITILSIIAVSISLSSCQTKHNTHQHSDGSMHQH
ncbi:hypothetical protein BH11VER1_BH11VER1_01080 [soil metagenome]